MDASVIDPGVLKDFLYDRTIYAFAALELVALVWAIRGWLGERAERIEDWKTIAPLTEGITQASEDLLKVVSTAIAARTRRQHERDERSRRGPDADGG